MGGFDIGLGDGEIAAHHVERGVAENPLQRVNVPLVSQILNRKRVAESVRVHVGDASAPADALQDVVQVAGIERAAPIGAISLSRRPGRE